MKDKIRHQQLKDKALKMLALELGNLLSQPSIREFIIWDDCVTNLNVLDYWVNQAKELLKDEE